MGTGTLHNTTDHWIPWCRVTQPTYLLMALSNLYLSWGHLFEQRGKVTGYSLCLQWKKILPYFFFVLGHVKYARYGLYYLRSMQRLDSELLKRFMSGEHVMRHQDGRMLYCQISSLRPPTSMWQRTIWLRRIYYEWIHSCHLGTISQHMCTYDEWYESNKRWSSSTSCHLPQGGATDTNQGIYEW